jgi:hypothetical protein
MYVPDERGCLAPASLLAYNDVPWMLDGGGGDVVPAVSAPDEPPAPLGMDLSSLRLVHPKISHLVAEAVGVRSLRRQMLAQAADSVALSLVSRTVSFALRLHTPHQCRALTLVSFHWLSCCRTLYA